MSEEILINVTSHEVRVALLENGVLQELQVERCLQQGLVSNIYKGRVSRLLPGIQAAFIDIGLERAGFLHARDVTGYDKLISQTDNVTHVDIRDLLYVGQDILVQVSKDPLGSKGARLTTQFTIPSRYLVFTPGMSQVAVSLKLANEIERQRLINLITPDEEGGYIFRTVAEGATQAEVDADKAFLNTLWKEVKARIGTAKVGEKIYEEIPIVLRVLRDLAGFEVARIRVDNEASVKEMLGFAERYIPKLVERIEYYASDRPIFDIYSVEDELQRILQRKVYLKSGGYLVFDQTEAMTTIDVNTGSYVGRNDLEQTIFKINLEAAEMIARQVRLRNLGGIIIVDFIDMEDLLHKEHLMQVFTAILAKDNVRVELSELSRLGLVQMTRKRTRESLEHILCVSCPLCQRRGYIKSYATMASEIFRELKRIGSTYPWLGFLVLASQGVVDFILEEEPNVLAELEGLLGKPIKLQVKASYTQEHYDILPYAGKE